MKKNYYRIAIERYFSISVPYFLILSVPVMMYGYFENDYFFWIGLGATVVLLVLNHLIIHSITSVFGIYVTKKQVNYVKSFVKKDNKALTEKESSELFEMMASQMGNPHVDIENYIHRSNLLLEEKMKQGNAEAYYWLGIYHHVLGESEDHNQVAYELIEKSAELGSERAKKLQKNAKKLI